MTGDLATSRRAAVDVFRKQFRQELAAGRGQGRLSVGLDATESRKAAWKQAAVWTRMMIEEAAKIGGLEIQVACYYGVEFEHSNWTTNSRELTDWMRRIECTHGATQILRYLEYVRQEHRQKSISAAIFVGDTTDGDSPAALIDTAAGLGVPLFMFQEGDDPEVEKTFREMARVSKELYFKFTADSWRDVADLLREIAVYAAGGVKALESRNTEAARKLLGHLKKGDEKK